MFENVDRGQTGEVIGINQLLGHCHTMPLTGSYL